MMFIYLSFGELDVHLSRHWGLDSMIRKIVDDRSTINHISRIIQYFLHDHPNWMIVENMLDCGWSTILLFSIHIHDPPNSSTLPTFDFWRIFWSIIPASQVNFPAECQAFGSQPQVILCWWIVSPRCTSPALWRTPPRRTPGSRDGGHSYGAMEKKSNM